MSSHPFLAAHLAAERSWKGKPASHQEESPHLASIIRQALPPDPAGLVPPVLVDGPRRIPAEYDDAQVGEMMTEAVGAFYWVRAAGKFNRIAFAKVGTPTRMKLAKAGERLRTLSIPPAAWMLCAERAYLATPVRTARGVPSVAWAFGPARFTAKSLEEWEESRVPFCAPHHAVAPLHRALCSKWKQAEHCLRIMRVSTLSEAQGAVATFFEPGAYERMLGDALAEQAKMQAEMTAIQETGAFPWR